MKILILITCLLLPNYCYCATTFQQTITTIPAAVNITAINTSAAQGTIDAATGYHHHRQHHSDYKQMGQIRTILM